MNDEDLRAILNATEESLKSHSDELMAGYIAQYQEMVAKAAEDMKKMVLDAQEKINAAEKPKEVHMKWAEVNGQHVLVLSERAGKDILNAFDVLAKLLPQLQKALKGR